MLLQGEETSLKLEITGYEFPADGGMEGSDDRNWLVLRGTYTDEDGRVIVASQACLLTYELRELTAGLKVVAAGVKDAYGSAFVEPIFEVSAQAEDNGVVLDVALALLNTMEEMETAEVECTMTCRELLALTDELDALCEKFPDRV